MTTGVHVVRDLRCCRCLSVLGWKYVSLSCFPYLFLLINKSQGSALSEDGKTSQLTDSNRLFLQDKAYEVSQRYKEGKFILEKACVSPWTLDSSPPSFL
jgi:hypothetical protein